METISDFSIKNNEDILLDHELKPIMDFIEEVQYNPATHHNRRKSVLINKNGKEFIFECMIFDDMGFELSINNITYEEEKKQLKKQLTQNIAHELKTPVSSIQGYLETIVDRPNLPDNTRITFLNKCYAQSNRLAKLLQDLSLLTRMEEIDDLYEKQEIDIYTLVTTILEDIELDLSKKNIKVHNLLRKPLCIKGSQTLIYSIFRNLLDNSISYAGENIDIFIDSYKDTGVGIPTEHLNRLFERFYRVDEGRNSKTWRHGPRAINSEECHSYTWWEYYCKERKKQRCRVYIYASKELQKYLIMKHSNIILAISLLLGFSSCKNATQKSDNSDKNSAQSEVTLETDFPLPEIPIMLINPEERGEYLAKHFWDKLDLTDTVLINNKELIEQKWVNYLDILARFQEKESPKLIEQLLTKFKSSPSAYLELNELCNRYLYESDSPFRNDLMYVAVLNVRLKDPNITDTQKEQLKYKLDLCNKNNKGVKAENISFTTPNSKTERLHNIKAEHIILFFNDLNCNLCANATEKLRSSELISDLEQQGKLKIVTINIGDDFTLWKKKVSTWPKTWINGYDSNMNIINNNSFDLRVIPSFYLLDKDKKVMLKDKPLAEIMETLVQL